MVDGRFPPIFIPNEPRRLPSAPDAQLGFGATSRGGPEWPGRPDRPDEFPSPGQPGRPYPLFPSPPGTPGTPAPGDPGPGGPGPVPPTRVWLDPHTAWQDSLYERLMAQRIVLASGVLDDDAATRLSAQLLTLDAEGDGPIRLELQNLRAELPAALTVMGVLDVVRAPVHAFASGETGGAALGVLASCPRRAAYPNASFTLSEPKMQFGGTVTAVTAREQQARRMVDSLFYRIADAAGRPADEIREDARRNRTLTTAEAIGYGLITERVTKPADPPA
jgi:ATP-dependent Clp protease, protease subunit